MKKIFLLILLIPLFTFAANYKQLVSDKKLTYLNEKCSGMSFVGNSSNAFMYMEKDGACSPLLFFDAKWISNDTVMLTERESSSKKSKHVFILQFQSVYGNKVTIKDIRVGGNSKLDEIRIFTMKPLPMYD